MDEVWWWGIGGPFLRGRAPLILFFFGGKGEEERRRKRKEREERGGKVFKAYTAQSQLKGAELKGLCRKLKY